MSRILFASVVAAGALTLSLSTANAQGIASDCSPTQGNPCFTLTPLEVNRGTSIIAPDGVELLDAGQLGQTYACNVVTGDTVSNGVGGPMIQDCGPPASLSDVKPYYGTKPTTMAAPAPVEMVAAPVEMIAPAAPVVMAPAAPVVVAAPAAVPVMTAPVMSAGGLALGTPGLIATAAGVAGLLGIIGLIASSDDSD